jgi:hypothetical protein
VDGKVESNTQNGTIIPMFPLKYNKGTRSKELNDIDI